VDADLRASLYAAIGAAALSALVGVFAGVFFIWIVVRALAFGALLGAAVYGAAYLIRRSLPGLLPEDRPGEGGEGSDAIFSSGSAEPATGSRVDIVLPGEGAEAGLDASDVEDASEAEEVTMAGDEAPSARQVAEDVSFIEEREAAGGPVAAVPPPHLAGDREAKPDGIDDLDVLPDLDGFTDSFAAAEFSSSGGAAAAPQSRVEESGSQRSTDGLDPASLAKAVRTILKRDQKG